MKTKLVIVLILIVLSLQTGCLYPVRYDGPYHGKVVDEQTRKPLESAVVLGTWSVYHFDPGGGNSTYYDAREAVTDKNGEFTIPGQGLRIFSSIKPIGFTIFKAGYSYFSSYWDSLKIETRKDMIKWEGETPVIPIRKLTDEERKKQGSPSRPNIPTEKMQILTKEINKERVYLGLTPFDLGGDNK